jgi:hypothetical protein
VSHLPIASEAQQTLVVGTCNRGPGLFRQLGRVLDPPQEDVGVEQETHQTYSLEVLVESAID